MKKLFFLIIAILLSSSRVALSVNENTNWMFGYNAGITFKTSDGEPIALDSSSIYNFEGCSSISDKEGNLLFYTDGKYIFNKYHKRMNGNDSILLSQLSATQSSLIVPIPDKYNEFYIFTTDAGEYYKYEDGTIHTNRGLNYTKLNVLNEKIQIDSLNINLLEKSTEKITATKHANNKNYWVVSRGWDSDKFFTYLITNRSIELSKSQSIGNITSNNWRECIGYMKFSADSKYLAYVNEGRDYFELFRFDNRTGEFSEPLVIPTSGRFYNYGLEFSANGRYIYISESKNGEIYRYDISNYNADEIRKSEFKIYKELQETFLGALQIAPNEKIYFARYKFKYLGEICSPDSAKSNVIADAVYLGNETVGNGSYGLPNMIQSNNKYKVVLCDTTVCQYSDLEINPDINFLIDYMKFEWTGPNNFSSANLNLTFNNIDLHNAGKYYLKSTYGDKILFDSIEINVSESPIAEIVGPSHICGNVPIHLSSKYQNENYNYYWSNGKSTPIIEVKEAGTYVLEISNSNNCVDADTIIVTGSIIDVNLSKNEIFIDKICLSENHIENICIYNVEKNEILLLDIISNNQNIIINNIENIKINGDNSYCFDIKISSDKPILINDSIKLKFKSSDCEMEYFIKINCSVELDTKIEINKYEKAPGDYFCIDLQLNNLCNNSVNLKSNYEAILSYNSEYFYIDTIMNGSQIDKKIIDTTTYLTLKSNEIDFSKNWDNLAICGTVMTGGYINSPIKIESIKWDKELINTDTVNGSLKIVSCAINIRPIKLYKPSSLVSYQDSEGNLIIKYTSEIPGNHNISITNLNGEIISEISVEKINDNQINQEYVIQNSHLVTGLYIILIKNSFYSAFFKQIILK